MSKTIQITASLTACLLGAALSGSADAATTTRLEFLMGTQNCQSALPVFDTNLRKRPLAVQNEGTSTAFVTCGFQGANMAAPLITLIGVFLRNNTAAPIDITCTLVDAGSNFSTPLFFTKTTNVAANASSQIQLWSTADNGGIAFIYPSLSCQLPPGTGISGTAQQFPEEIGT